MTEDLFIKIQDYIKLLLLEGVKPCIHEKGDRAFISDSFFSIQRNRVNAEICKALIFFKDLDIYCDKGSLIEKLLNGLKNEQNYDGSWNEIHPFYNKKSSLETSIIGEAFLLNQWTDCVQDAASFVLSNEIKPGYFLKSEEFSADCLNVNATCGAFLSLYGQRYNDEEMKEAGSRAAKRVVKYQFDSGAYPYTTQERGNFPYNLYVPCVHYQGVTLYYLIKIQKIIKKKWLDDSIKKGIQWMELIQRQNGSFDWSSSGHMFSYYLSGAYAFSIPVFLYLDKRKNAYLSLKQLSYNTRNIVNRWEMGMRNTFINDLPITLKSANLGDYPFSYRTFRLLYGVYRQYSRRRYSEVKKDTFFKIVTKALGLKVSTIEPSFNYPDMFMTSQVLDCLGYSSFFLQRRE
jgi:hypothetical protein